MNSGENESMNDLLIKCITGKASDKEYEEAYHWIEQNNDNREHFNSLYNIWFAVGMRRKPDPSVEHDVWNRLEGPKRKKSRIPNPVLTSSLVIKTGRIAALFIIAFSIGFLLKTFLQKNPGIERYTVEASKGAKSGITLADGTYVLLNAGSKLSYTSSYNHKTREVDLSGEGYFIVAKNKTKPFRVQAGGVIINALGTAFNVKAYPEDRTVETTLVEGSVSIRKEGMGATRKPVILKPNQHAVYYKTDEEFGIGEGTSGPVSTSPAASKQPLQSIKGKIILTPKIEPEVYVSWKDKRWVFHSEPFGEFAKELERLYDISIHIEDKELSNYKLTGSIEEENIEMVLKALQLIIPIDYEFGHKRLIVKLNDSLKYNFDQTLKKTKN